jgi:hypothetical protein
LTEGEHTIAFVSSISFRFAIQCTVSWPFPSNPLCLLSLSVPLEPASMAEPPPPADSRPLSASPTLVRTSTRSPRPPLLFPHRVIISSSPEPLNPHRPGAPVHQVRSEPEKGTNQRNKEKVLALFRFRPWRSGDLVITRLILVSWQNFRVPPRKIPPFAHKSHPRLFQI